MQALWSRLRDGWFRWSERYRLRLSRQEWKLVGAAIVFLGIGAVIGGYLATPLPEESWPSTVQMDELRHVIQGEIALLWEENRTAAPVPTPVESSQQESDERTAVVPPEPERPNPVEQEASAAAVASSPASLRFERLLWPVRGDVALDFGWYRHPDYLDWHFYPGLEIVAQNEEPVRAVLGGQVERLHAGVNGLELVVAHGGGWQSVYRYISQVQVELGEALEPNQTIGTTGEDQRIYYGLRLDDKPVDPRRFMR